MSIPKSVNRTVKRRGLAIATAVAIAGSGVVSGNYAFAKELGDDSRAMTPGLVTGPGGNQTDSAINGPTENVDETSAEKENLNQSVTAVEYFNQHESGIVASLRPADISEAPGAEAVANHFLTQAKKDGVAVDSVWESDFHRLVAARERAVLPEYYSPSAQDYFDHYARDIAAALRPSDNSQAMGTDAVVAHYVAQAEDNDIDVDDAWKSEFRELVQAKERALYPEFYVAEAADYFAAAESLIAGDLRPADGSDALGVDAVVDKYASKVESDQLDFGAANDKEAWKSEFRELVQAKERALYPEFYVAEAADYFAAAESLIAGDLRPADGSDALGVDAVVDKYASKVESDQLDFGVDNDKEAWKSEFRELVQAKERALYPEFYVAEAADYFEHAESLIAGDLRPADGSDALGVDAVVDKYADEVRGKGLDFGAANDEAAWKSEFRELVQAKERALYPEFYVAEAADYFEHAESLIAGDLRPADGSDALGVDAVVDKYASKVESDQLDFGVDNDKEAWKSEFRELVQQLADKLEAEDAAAHRAVLDNELDVNSNPVVDPNKESLTAEDLAAPFAKHRDEVAKQEAVEAAEDLVEAKRAAKAAIDGAQHLSDAQKVAYKGAVDAASTERQVEELVYGALDGAEQAEDYAKIQEQLGSNGTPAFSPNEKPWTPEDFLNSFRQNAANEAAKKLEETKSAATADVEGAARLTENQKSEFKDRIGAAKTVEEVKAVLDEAHKLVDKLASEDEEKATLEKEKQEAYRIIDGLNKLSLEQKAAFKKQVDDANTGAYVAHIVERAQEVNAQQYPSGDGAGAQEPGKPGNNETPGKPGSDNKPGQDQKPGSTTDAFKGFFGLAAGLGVFALIFGGILHTVNHFDGFGVVQEHVRNAFAKIGIRF